MATPVAYSNIAIDNRTRIVADDSGRFRVLVDSGRTVRLSVRRIGYKERDLGLSIAEDTTLSITLGRIAQFLPTRQIESEKGVRSLDINGFYRRRESGIFAGYFITPEDIDQRRPYRATQMLDGIPGVRLTRAGNNDFRWVILGVDRCPMSIYLDRVRPNSMGNRGAAVFIDDIVSSTSLSGIEVYTSAVKAPPEFQPLNGTCGVMLLWTK